MKIKSRNSAATAWWAFGGLLAAGVAFMVIRELPAIRRELHILRM
ncbi:MAG TPA: hypothetical protein VG167_04840 [Verrucomicrobiae bacterium]|jgi:hypothetical protein|nr:hypothetical protein [Verrucomicrobiae bacterium]